MKKLLGFLAIAGLLVIAAPAPKAEAAMMAPGVAKTLTSAPASVATESLATEVRWRRRYWAPRRYYRPHRYYAPRRYYRPHRYYGPRVRFY